VYKSCGAVVLFRFFIAVSVFTGSVINTNFCLDHQNLKITLYWQCRLVPRSQDDAICERKNVREKKKSKP
jgi:hypothetical protein